MKEIWNQWSSNCKSRKRAHLFMPFGRSNTCGHPLLTRTLKYLNWIEQVTWNARLNAADAHFGKGKPTFVWSQHVFDFLQLLRLHPVWDVFVIWSESESNKKGKTWVLQRLGLLVFIVISLWSANKSAVPRNWPHGRFAAHDLSLQAIDCRTWRFGIHILQKGGRIMQRLTVSMSNHRIPSCKKLHVEHLERKYPRHFFSQDLGCISSLSKNENS